MLTTLFSLLLGLSAAQAAGPSFCLQHFNLYGPLYATQIADRTARVTQELTSENPECDVVQLIEVWSAAQAHQVMDGMSRDYVISAPNLQSRIGIMSLLRGEIKTTETHDFVINNEDGILDDIRNMAGVKKAFHVVTAKLPQLDEEIYLIETHLHPSSPAVRIAQILDIYNWRLRHQDKKMVLSGDFNAEKNSLERDLLMGLLAAHDSMQEVLGGTYPDQFCSYCEDNPRSWLRGNHLFDYVFFSNVSATPSVLKPVSGMINLKGTPGNTLSDHYGLRVYFELDSSLAPLADLNLREQNLQTSLQKAQGLLMSTGAYLESYVVELNNISFSLQQKRGLAWEYFSQYR